MIRPNAPNTTTLETPLPFDLRTVAVSILRYRWILLLWHWPDGLWLVPCRLVLIYRHSHLAGFDPEWRCDPLRFGAR